MKKISILILICWTLIAKADYWTQKASFPGVARAECFSFSIGNKGYIGCGFDSSLTPTQQDFWEYDKATNAWTQKSNYGGGIRWGAIGFSIGNLGYAGLGVDSSHLLHQDFWEYNPSNNTWTQKADFGGGNRYTAVGFSIGNMGYVGTGENNTTECNDLWQYNAITDLWIQKASMPSYLRVDANCFIIGTNGYVVGGWTSGILSPDLWEYNSILDSWTQKANIPSNPRQDAAAFTICDKGYYGMGESYNGVLIFLNDLWQYNPSSNTWIQKANFPGQNRDELASFSIGNNGYFGLGGTNGWVMYNDFWEYTPDSACATGIEELPTSNLEFSISPNPAKDFLIINSSLNGKEKINLAITDVDGKKVFESQLLQSTISIKDFSKGIYFVEVNNGKQKAVKKFVKE